MSDLIFFACASLGLILSVAAIGLWVHRYLWSRRLARVIVSGACLVMFGIAAEFVHFVHGWVQR